MQKFSLTLDLKDDAYLINEYEQYHQAVWPEIQDSIRAAGITELEIYRISNRLFMIIEADDAFSFERKSAMDASNEKVIEWEQLMWKYQQALPTAKAGEKWLLMKRIYSLNR